MIHLKCYACVLWYRAGVRRICVFCGRVRGVGLAGGVIRLDLYCITRTGDCLLEISVVRYHCQLCFLFLCYVSMILECMILFIAINSIV